MGHALPLRIQFFSLYCVGWNLVTRLNEREVEVQLAITVLFASPNFFFSMLCKFYSYVKDRASVS